MRKRIYGPPFLLNACNNATAGCGAKESDICDLGVLVKRIIGYVWPHGVPGHFWGSYGTLLLQYPGNSKIAGPWVKRVEIWDPITTYMRHLWPFSIQCQLEVVRYTCLEMPCSSKSVDHKAKGIEIGDLGEFVEDIWGILTLVVFNVIWGSFGALLSGPYTKRLAVEQNGFQFGTQRH